MIEVEGTVVESLPNTTFRVDIDVATCGEITPLSTLDYLIGSFDSDIITMDYRGARLHP